MAGENQMQRTLGRAAFAAVHPLCIGLVQPNQDTISTVHRLIALKAVMEGLPEQGLQACLDYIFVPLFLHLRPDSQPAPVIEAALQALHLLLTKCRIGPSHFLPVLQALIPLLSQPRNKSTEEIRRGVLECAGVFFSRLRTEEADLLRDDRLQAARGHLLSEFLRIADEEVAAGLQGSKQVHALAMTVLDTFLQTVNDPDALAFFLPGVASGLSRALLAPKVGASGSAAAVRALSSLLAIVLADEANPGLGSQPAGLPAPVSAASTLQALRQLSVRPKSPSVPSPPKKAEHVAPSRESMSVARDQEWLSSTVPRIQSMLQVVLPKLCTSDSPKVRAAIGQLAAHLLERCQQTLSPAAPLLLECLLALSCDEYVTVSSSSRAFLTDVRILRSGEAPTSGHHGVSEATLIQILNRQLVDLPRSLKRGDDATALMQARKVSAVLALLMRAGKRDILQDTALLSALSSSLLQCIEFESSPARVTEYQPPAQYLTLNENMDAMKAGSATPAPSLPQMPEGLAQVRSRPMYEGLARACRLMGRIGRQGGQTALAAVVSPFLGVLQQTAATLEVQAPTEEGELQNQDSAARRSGASAVLILNEIIFGASPAWSDSEALNVESPLTQEPSSSGLHTDSKADNGAAGANCSQAIEIESNGKHETKKEIATVSHESDRGLLDLINRVVNEYLAPELWECPVEVVPGSKMSLSTARDNARLQQMMIEGIGSFARALGRAFASDGALMSSVLFPLLSKLGSTNAQISSAADLALQSICAHGGYASLRELVAANSDYVVDALCRQLRHVHLHPTAPLLFVSVLRKTRATADLIPLLAEPLASVLQGLGVKARGQHPQHSLAFLMALREVARAAFDEAQEVLGEISGFDVHSKDSEAPSDEAQKVSGFKNVDVLSEESSKVTADVDTEEATAGGDRIENVKKTSEEAYESVANVERKGEKSMHEISTGGNREGLQRGSEEWWEVHKRRRESTAAVACSAVDACAPLMGSRTVQNRVVAMDIAEVGMRALAAAERAEKAHKKIIEASSPPEEFTEDEHKEIEISNRVLPRIHSLWPHVVLGLKHPYAAVIERTLALISSLAIACGGDFMARRIETDAWPLMSRLLISGVPSKGLLASPRASLMILEHRENDTKGLSASPAADERVRLGVLSCLESLAENTESRGAMGRMAGEMATQVASYLEDKGPQVLRSKASDTLLGLAKVDGDAVWLLLADLASMGILTDEAPLAPEGFPQLASILARSTRVTREATQGARLTLEKLEAREKLEGPSCW